MTTEAIAKVYVNQTDAQIIKKYGLKLNSTTKVKSILEDLNKVVIESKVKMPQDYKGMSQWGNKFEIAWLSTKSLNKDNVTPLSYLINYCIETNTQGFDLMTQVAFMPSEFQIIFAKYLVRSK
jgi:hypothetical protein